MGAWKKNINHSIALKNWPSLWSSPALALARNTWAKESYNSSGKMGQKSLRVIILVLRQRYSFLVSAWVARLTLDGFLLLGCKGGKKNQELDNVNFESWTWSDKYFYSSWTFKRLMHTLLATFFCQILQSSGGYAYYVLCQAAGLGKAILGGLQNIFITQIFWVVGKISLYPLNVSFYYKAEKF